jgi:ketosteroid isomerase-like protein
MHEDQEQLARTFLSILDHPDVAKVKSVSTSDIVWSFPGTGEMSGETQGLDRLVARARTFAASGATVDNIRPLFDLGDFGMLMHCTGNKDGRALDGYLGASFSFRDGKIARVDMYASDVDAVDEFFR